MKDNIAKICAILFLSAGVLAAPLAAQAGPVCCTPADPAGPESVTPTNDWIDFYSYHLTFAGVPAPAGTYVAAYDPQGTQCGERTTNTASYLAPIMPCYGDTPTTPADEGADEGDAITFTVNGAPASAVARARNWVTLPSAATVIWHSKDLWEIDLTASAQPPLTITPATGQSNLSWQPAVVNVATYEVWRADHAYFNPVAGEAELIATLPATANPLAWTDTTGVGDPALNVAYRVVSKNSGGTMTGASQPVGEFDYELLR